MKRGRVFFGLGIVSSALAVSALAVETHFMLAFFTIAMISFIASGMDDW